MRMGAADQAKLLLFALLRSTATALATTGEKARLIVPPPFAASSNIQLRLATRTDVNSIQACNLACLPENYNAQFYASHLRQWPDLALVAEEVSDSSHKQPSSSSSVMADQDRNPRFHFSSPYPNEYQQQQQQRSASSEPKIVAYVLGKVESRPVTDYGNPFQTYRHHQVETIGHVTSLAVREDYRRMGIAKSLMDQLHHHLWLHRGVQACGLHVRTSNQAACRLYQKDGYEVAQIIPSYYQDGEDAYFMRKRLGAPEGDTTMTATTASIPASHPLFASMRRKNMWKSGAGEFRLPRKHVVMSEASSDANSSSSSSSGSTTVSLEGDGNSVRSGASSVSFETAASAASTRDYMHRRHENLHHPPTSPHVGALLDQ